MSQRNRPPRDRARNTGHGTGEELSLWNEIRASLAQLEELRLQVKERDQKLFDTEAMFKARLDREGTSKAIYSSLATKV
jgi:hypothetical protein